MGSLKIDVLGTSFTINVNEDDSYLNDLLSYYKKIIGQIQQSGALTDKVQISALAGIMLCDELFKAKMKLKSDSHEASQKSDRNLPSAEQEKAGAIAEELIKKISEVL